MKLTGQQLERLVGHCRLDSIGQSGMDHMEVELVAPMPFLGLYTFAMSYLIQSLGLLPLKIEDRVVACNECPQNRKWRAAQSEVLA